MIEQKIDQLIEAINSLTEALNSRADGMDCCGDDGHETKEQKVLQNIVDTLGGQKPRKERKKKEAPATATTDSSGSDIATYNVAPVAEPAPAPAPEPVAEEPALTVADLREVAQKALDAGKLNEVIALNKEYGLKRISDANPAQYGEIIAKLNALLSDGQA